MSIDCIMEHTTSDIVSRMSTMRLRSSPAAALDRLGMSDTGEQCALLKLATSLWNKHGGPRPMQVEIEMAIAFRLHSQGREDEATNSIRSSWGYISGENGEVQQGFSLDQIEAEMTRHRILAVYVDMLDYSIAETPGMHNQSQSHSCLLFLARSGETWIAYYFNPHGKVALSDTTYELYHTRSRLKQIQSPVSLDEFVIKKLITCLSEQVGTQIIYSDSYTSNYKGPNLQKGDTLGVCYVFPVLLQLELARFSTEAACSLIAKGRAGSLVSQLRRALQALGTNPSSDDIASVLLFLLRQSAGHGIELISQARALVGKEN